MSVILPHFIKGALSPSTAKKHGDVFNPATGECIAKVPFATIEEIQKAVENLKMKLSDFKNIQTKLTQIDNASDYIRENIDRLKKDIENGLTSIKELLNN